MVYAAFNTYRAVRGAGAGGRPPWDVFANSGAEPPADVFSPSIDLPLEDPRHLLVGRRLVVILVAR
jgi:hypothetical protein